MENNSAAVKKKKAILFYSEVNSEGHQNQDPRKALFTCVDYTNL